MKGALLLTLAVTLAASAQPTKKPEESSALEAAAARTLKLTGPRFIQRVYQVKHTDLDELTRLVYTTPSGQGQTPIVRGSQALRAITVYGTEDEVESIMASLKALDIPRSAAAANTGGFELTMFVLLAGAQGELPGTPVPDSLNAVTAQLRQVFGLAQFKVLEASILRGSSGGQQYWSGIAGPYGDYTTRFGRAQIDGGSSAPVVRLADFLFELRSQKGMVRFGTNLELREGQQVVVGKANVDGTDKSLVLVLVANVAK